MGGDIQKVEVDLDSLQYHYCPPLQDDFIQAVRDGKEPVLAYENKGHLSLIKHPEVRKLIAEGISRLISGRKKNRKRKNLVTYYSYKNDCLGGIDLLLKRERGFNSEADGKRRTVIGVYVKIRKTVHNRNGIGNNIVQAKDDKYGYSYVISIGDFLHHS